VRYFDIIKAACTRCAEAAIRVSLFIDPDHAQIDAARRSGATVVELHTGKYADADSVHEREHELKRIHSAAEYAHAQGLQVNAGHGLNYHNVQPVVAIPHLVELNIGHAIIAESLFIGLEAAVKKMKALLSAQPEKS
jgi:pyridoxine 5-phosphate synthase